EELFVRGVSRQQEADAVGIRGAGGGESFGELRGRVAPRRRLLQAVRVFDERLAQPVGALAPRVLESADVGHPGGVHPGIEARREANQARTFRPLGLRLDPGGDVAALRALRTDGVGGERIVPRPRLEPVVARGDGADRTDVHQVAGDQRVDALFLERRDLAAVAAIDDVDLRVAVDLAHEAHAARAQDAAVAIQHQRRTEVDIGFRPVAVEDAPRKLHAALIGSEGVGEILQRALAAFVAHRAVERMVDQEELEHAGARRLHVRRPRRYDHAVGADGRTGGLQLRHFFDLHDAHAARAVDADARVIAVVGDRDSAFDRGLENCLAFLDSHRLAVDRQRYSVHKTSIIPRAERSAEAFALRWGLSDPRERTPATNSVFSAVAFRGWAISFP